MKTTLAFLAVIASLILLVAVCQLVGVIQLEVATATLALLVLAGMLYRMRERQRLFYGAVELSISLVSAVLILWSLAQNTRGIGDEPLIVRMALLFASVYVMVRALDNIGIGLKEAGPNVWWDRARRAPEEGSAPDPNQAVFDLPLSVVAGDRPLHLAFRVVRSQDVLFYSRQRYRGGPDQTLHMAALNVATNRRYDGAGTQPPLNAAAKHFFGDPPTAVFSPVDAWSFEFSESENGQHGPSPFSAPGSKPGNVVFDGAEIGDLVLTVEYETGAA